MSDATTTTETLPPVMWAASDSQLLPHGIELGASHLTVRSLDRALPWYTDALGLTVAEQTQTSARLASAGGDVVVELTEDPAATAPGRSAGLYHVALNMGRLELSRMVRRIVQAGATIEGASDHGTHEAIYLPDPDGNGFELAADRDRADWPDWNEHPGSIQPQALDIEALFAVSGDDTIPRHAESVTTGHLHLHVGDIDEGLAHYRDIVGFDVKFHMPTAAFVSADGYHHHLGFNVWNGLGVSGAPEHSTGLRYWSVIVPTRDDVRALEVRLTLAGSDVFRDHDGALLVPDPWGTTLRVTARD
ncbi:MAG: VOC family protein [Thermoleophilia bacterium]|nr:VOC family protein [Thermoleophilia bacterium]